MVLLKILTSPSSRITLRYLKPKEEDEYMSEELELDREKVFFICTACGYLFTENPERMPVRCPQCDSEDTERV